MRKVALVGMCVLLGLLAGLVLRPDDGTEVKISPAESGAVVSGVDHAKPLPRPATVTADIVRDLMALSAMVLTALVIALGPSTVVRLCADPQRLALVLARAGSRRGPPAPA